ncbi:MAG: hypothetical protein V2I33_26000, partial [Kangiellaceae bacterium]|nr:hypothetical protein [Kangiellaceae bacterium]
AAVVRGVGGDEMFVICLDISSLMIVMNLVYSVRNVWAPFPTFLAAGWFIDAYSCGYPVEIKSHIYEQIGTS